MTVTELALLHCKSPSTTSRHPPFSDTAIDNLKHGANQQAAYSKHPVALLQCQEDPTMVYLIGGWDSIEQHMTEWIPGQVNQDIMAMLNPDIDVKWMFHLNADSAEVFDQLVRRPYVAEKEDVIRVVAIERYFVVPGDRDAFNCTWEGNVDALDELAGEAGTVKKYGSWRADRGYEQGHAGSVSDGSFLDEFILFSVWKNIQHDPNFKRSAKIDEYVSGVETKHGKVFYVADVN